MAAPAARRMGLLGMAAALLLTATGASAETTKERILREGRIVIGIHNRSPWGFRDEKTGKPTGWHPDILKAAFADLGKLMARSQDLRLFVLAAKLSILNRDVGGFVDCLSAMADILGENWDAVHPRAMDGDVIMREVAL